MSVPEYQAPQEQVSPEDRLVIDWRYDQFHLLGFGVEESWLLVTSGADLQLTRSLVGAGCPLYLALRIVL
jgi:hypothetical protein